MSQYFLYRLGLFLALSLPLKYAYGFAKFASTVQYLCSKKDRNCVRNNLRAVFPDESDGKIDFYTKQVFINFGKYLADFFRYSKIDRKFLKEKLKIEGLDYLDNCLKQNKGVIIISAHLGNWELGGAVVGMLGYNIVGVVLPHKDRRVDAFFNSQRESKNLEVCPLGRAAHYCLDSLSQNKIIALISDRDFTNHGLILDFLNKKSVLPKGPAAFHLKTQAPIVPAFCIRCEDDKFRLIIEPPLNCELTGDREKDIEIITKSYAAIVEKYIKAYPDQWYMFRKYWVD